MPASRNRLRSSVFSSPATWPHGAAEAWESAQAPVSLFSARSRRADWRPATEVNVEQAYRTWLRWSARRKTFPPETGFVDRVTPAEVEDHVADLRTSIADSSISAQLAFLKMALHTMAPQHDWSWMDRAISSVKRSAKPIRHKRQRIVSMHELVSLGYDLMESSGCTSGEVPRRDQAMAYRDGLIIALMAVRPFRLKNFSGAMIGENLVERDGSYWMCFRSSETKNGEELEQPVPEFLHDHLRLYLDQVRPVLATRRKGSTLASCNYLWLTSLGSPIGGLGLYRAVTSRTKVRFGHSLNPHIFRDCLATTIANEDPDNVQLIKFVLGHRRSTTADKYYIHAQSNLALTRIQEHVLALRAATPLDLKNVPTAEVVNRGSGSCIMRLPQAGATAHSLDRPQP